MFDLEWDCCFGRVWLGERGRDLYDLQHHEQQHDCHLHGDGPMVPKGVLQFPEDRERRERDQAM